MPAYFSNCVATKSSRAPPPLTLENQCGCSKAALKVEMVTWDHRFSPHLLQLFTNCVLYQDLHRQYCPSASAIQREYNWSRWATSHVPQSTPHLLLTWTSWSLSQLPCITWCQTWQGGRAPSNISLIFTDILLVKRCMPSLPGSCMALKSHLGRDPAAFQECITLVSSSHCYHRPGSQYMGSKCKFCCDDAPWRQQRHRFLQWHRKQHTYIRASGEDSYNILSDRYAERVTPSIPIAERLSADGRERTKHRCTIDISSMAVPNMLFGNTKSSDFHMCLESGGLYQHGNWHAHQCPGHCLHWC